MAAQTKSKNAFLASLKAAFLAFKAGLQADQGLFEAQTLRIPRFVSFVACQLIG